jgi:hypothetical protein
LTWVDVIGFGLLAAAILRIALIVRRPTEAKLPHPSEVDGMPMAGPASPAAAHAAINRKST